MTVLCHVARRGRLLCRRAPWDRRQPPGGARAAAHRCNEDDSVSDYRATSPLVEEMEEMKSPTEVGPVCVCVPSRTAAGLAGDVAFSGWVRVLSDRLEDRG